MLLIMSWPVQRTRSVHRVQHHLLLKHKKPARICNPLLFRVDAFLYKNLNFRMACHVEHILDSHLLAEYVNWFSVLC